MNRNNEANIKVTADSKEVVGLRKEVESLKREIRELKAGFAAMGVDADAALKKVSASATRTRNSLDAMTAGQRSAAAFEADLDRQAHAIIRRNQRLAMSRVEWARMMRMEREEEARAMRDAGRMSPSDYQMVRRGISRQFGEESGQAAERRQRKKEEERQRQADLQVGIRLAEQHATAQERYNARIARAVQLKKDQAISETVFKREVAAANEELRKQSDSFAGLEGAAARYLTIAAAIGAAWKTASMEYQQWKRVQEGAESTAVKFAIARSNAIQNLDESVTAAQFDAWVSQTSKRTNMAPSDLATAAAQVLGAKSGTSKQALDSLLPAIDLNRLTPEALGPTAVAVQGGMDADPKATAKGILGQQIQARLSGPINRQEDFARYIVPGAKSSRAFGDTPKDYYGFSAWLGSEMLDKEGRVTGTSAQDLRKDMQALRDRILADSKGKLDLGSSTYQRMRNLASDPRFDAYRRQQLGEMTTAEATALHLSGGAMTSEARAYGARRLALQNDPTVWATLDRKMREQVDSGAAGEALVDRQVRDLMSDPAHRVAAMDRTTQATGERVDLSNNFGARVQAQRKRMNTMLEKSGEGALNRMVANMQFDALMMLPGANPEAAASQRIGARAKSLRSGYYNPGMLGRDEGALSKAADLEASNRAAAEDRKVQEEILKEQKRANDILQQIANGGGANRAPNNVRPVAPRPAAGLVQPGNVNALPSGPSTMFSQLGS